MPKNDDVSFISSSLKISPFSHHYQAQKRSLLPFFSQLAKAKLSLTNLFDSLLTLSPTRTPNTPPIFCSASLSLTRDSTPKTPILSSVSLSLSQSQLGEPTQPDSVVTQQKASRSDEERVLISEVLVRNKDGEELERKDLEAEAVAALKVCRPNSALTVREVAEDVHRIVDSGYFSSCLPVAVDTRDGIRLIFQNQTRSFMV